MRYFKCILCLGLAVLFLLSVVLTYADTSAGSPLVVLEKMVEARNKKANLLKHIFSNYGFHYYQDRENLADGSRLRKNKHYCGNKLQLAYPLLKSSLGLLANLGDEAMLDCIGESCSFGGGGHYMATFYFRKNGDQWYLWILLAKTDGLISEEAAKKQEEKFTKFRKKAKKMVCK